MTVAAAAWVEYPEGKGGRRRWSLAIVIVLAVHALLAYELIHRSVVAQPEPLPEVTIEVELLPLPVETPPPPPVPMPTPVAELEPQKLVADVALPKKPKPRPKHKPRRDEPARKPEPVEAARVPVEDVPRTVSTSVAPVSSQAESAPHTPQPPSSAVVSWQGKLLTHLKRHQRYSMNARRQRLEGAPVVRFTMDRSGKVLHWQVVQSSGHALLDRDAEEMLRRANPLPKPPPEYVEGRDTFELSVPVEFSLRR